jgi:hypothetical protein
MPNKGIAMTTQMNSRYAFKVVFAIALTAMFAVAGSVGTGNGQQSATAIDVSALLTSAQIANLPVLTVAEPF